MAPPSKSSAASVTTAQSAGATKNNCTASDVRLEIVELTYEDNYNVNNDTIVEFPAPQWKEGRKADPDPTKQFPEQYPVAYVRKTRIKLTARFKVVERPACDTQVWIKGRAEISTNVYMEWKGQVTVGPSMSEISLANVSSDVELPNFITYYMPFGIEWFSNTGSSYKTRRAAGFSRNPLYVLLGVPFDPKLWGTTVMYWTIVDLSCRIAQKMTDEANSVPAFYKAFQRAQAKHPDPIRRMRDGHRLTYWNPVLHKDPLTGNLLYATPTRSAAQMLNNVDGCGRCGAWSVFMIDMCRLHGITSAKQIRITYSPNPDSFGMLVKNWSFSAAPDIPNAIEVFMGGQKVKFMHNVYSSSDPLIVDINKNQSGGCVDQVGVAAQGNLNPWPLFWDHAIVKHGGKYYDPSYGTPPRNTELEWEKGSLDGVFEQDLSSVVPSLLGAKHPGAQIFSFDITPY